MGRAARGDGRLRGRQTMVFAASRWSTGRARGGAPPRGLLLLLAFCLPWACSWGQGLTSGPQSILSRPLPGTLARDEYDLARSLEQALVGFEGVTGARALITRDADQPSSPRRAAVQLALADAFAPGAEWTGAVADFILQAVPELAPTELTIVDATGRTLYSAGVVRAAPPPPVAAAAPVPVGPWAVLLAGVLGLMAVAVALLRRREKRQEPIAPAPTGPFGFVQDLTDQELAVALGGERPAVVAAVLGRLPRETAGRAARALGVTPPASGAPEASAEVLAAVAEAMRRKLSEAGLR